jgi:replicative DNA helicase
MNTNNTNNNFSNEQAVIGGLMLVSDLSQNSAQKVLTMIRPASFQDSRHRVIFDAIQDLDRSGTSADLLTVNSTLERKGQLDFIGGIAYLADVIQNTPSAANLSHYADLVRQHSIKTAVNAKMQNAIAEFNDLDGDNIYQKLGQLESLIASLGQRASNGRENGLTHVKEIGKQWLTELNERKDDPTAHQGISTGISSIDQVLGSKLFVKGSLVVVGARPKMGKTAFLEKITKHVGTVLNKPAAVFSLEMPNMQLYERYMTSASKVSGDAFHDVQLTDRQWQSTSMAMNSLNNSKIYVDDTSSITLQYLKKESRKLAKIEPIGIIAVDYLTLMTAEKAERNDLAYGDITKGLKALAKELDCVVLLLTQLNRNLEQRGDKKPIPADSRDTGQIEQDCDYWIGLYRHAVYDDLLPEKYHGFTEAIVRLNRHGGIGSGYMNMTNGALENTERFILPMISNNLNKNAGKGF